MHLFRFRPRFTIGNLMIAVAVAGCAIGLILACVRLWEDLGFLDISIGTGPTIYIAIASPNQAMWPTALVFLMLGTIPCCYLLNRRRDRRKYPRP